jgi:hypothetical protein
MNSNTHTHTLYDLDSRSPSSWNFYTPKEQCGFAKEGYEDGCEDAIQVAGASLYTNANS